MLNTDRGTFSILLLISCILIGAVLKIASSVLLPIAIAVLLAFAMYPIVIWLEKHKIPHIVSIILVVIAIIFILLVFIIVLFSMGLNIISIYQRYEPRITEIYSWVAQIFYLPYDESLSFFENLWRQLGIRTWIRNFTFSFSNIFVSFLVSAILVVIFTLFILLEASHFKLKLGAAFNNRAEHISRIGRDLMAQITRFLTAKFFISIATGVTIGIGLWAIRLEYAIGWGLIAFMFNFIPNLGSIAAGVLTSLFALLQFWPNPVPIVLVVALILAVNIFIGIILDPKIVGDHVGLSPLVVLISLALWGYIWGFAGMLLSVPMTVIIKIICENYPLLEPISYLIGSKKSVNAKKAEQATNHFHD